MSINYQFGDVDAHGALIRAQAASLEAEHQSIVRDVLAAGDFWGGAGSVAGARRRSAAPRARPGAHPEAHPMAASWAAAADSERVTSRPNGPKKRPPPGHQVPGGWVMHFNGRAARRP